MREVYNGIKASEVLVRYITIEDILVRLNILKETFELEEIGQSHQGKPVKMVKAGHGPIKILAWSQMHGNETTTTKAVLDYLNFLGKASPGEAKEILSRVTLYFIPILNPDGAAAYTRVNAEGVDLNRDASELKAVESRILRDALDEIKPQYCFNLHDQRTIFSAGDSNIPATLSFLAPAIDMERSINPVRETAMQIIAGVNEDLQKELAGGIGRYDDSFNPNCTGDQFQQKVPTILFEAGHFPGDYQREETRYYMFLAIRSAVNHIVKQTYHSFKVESYFTIPENHKNFVDILLKHGNLNGRIVDIAIQFEEKLQGEEVVFIPRVQSIDVHLYVFGHQETDCRGGKILINGENRVAENDLVHSIMLNGKKLSFKTE